MSKTHKNKRGPSRPGCAVLPSLRHADWSDGHCIHDGDCARVRPLCHTRCALVVRRSTHGGRHAARNARRAPLFVSCVVCVVVIVACACVCLCFCSVCCSLCGLLVVNVYYEVIINTRVCVCVCVFLLFMLFVHATV